MQIAYRTKATVTGGRDGKAVTDDGKLNVKLITPKELGGPGGEATNPEQLFAAGYAACFLSAIKYVARNQKIAVSDSSTISASVGVGPRDDGTGFGLDVALQVSLPGLERAAGRAGACRMPLFARNPRQHQCGAERDLERTKKAPSG
jgi:lipoyl-dependent peroxiredoxin